MNHLARWMAAALALTSIADASISIQSFSVETNDRFANNAAFIAGDYDWSGVGRDSAGHWATMITPNVFLSATHFHPGVGTSVTFYPGNDPTAPSVSGVVKGEQQIGGTDLWIGYLYNALPSSIAYYSTVATPILPENFSTSGLKGAVTFMSGNSATSNGYGATFETNHAVGTNLVERFYSNVIDVYGRTGDTLVTVRNQSGDTGYIMTTYEAQLANLDSGSPMMVMSGENLYVAGIAWAIGTADIDPGVPRDLSYYTYTGNYDSAIQSYISLHSVPEPSTLILFAGLVVLIRRRR